MERKQEKNTRQKMHQIDLHISHGNYLLGMVLFLIFFLGLSTIIYADSYQKTMEEQRKTVYGSWHIALYHAGEKEKTNLKSHATVEESGEVYLSGEVLSKEGEVLNRMGFADANFFSIGNIILLDGRMPKQDDEVAMEASYLTRMGYSYELGQDIFLTIQNQNKKENIRQHFKLTGVIKNYSGYWKTETCQLPSFFVTKETAEKLAGSDRMDSHLFLKLKPEYVQNADSLKILCKDNGLFVKNDYVYQEYSEEPILDSGTLLQTIILLVGCVSIIMLIHNDLTRQKNNFITMRILGAQKFQIIQLYLKSKRRAILISILLGCFSGILFPFFLFLLLKTRTYHEICFELSAKNIFQLIVFLFAGIFFSFAIGLIRLFQIPLRGKPQQQSSLQNIPKRKKRLNTHNLFSILNTFDRRKRMASILFVFFSSAFLFFSAYQTWENLQTYQLSLKNNPEDYSFGLLTNYYEPRETMKNETVNQIKNCYGVGEIKTIAVSKYSEIRFSGEINEKYAELVRDILKETMGQISDLPDSQICGTLIGISPNLFPIYLNEIDNGADNELSAKKELENNNVILYLPNYFKTEDGEILQEDLNVFTKESMTKQTEGKIQPGDKVRIKTQQGKYTLNIIGIIYSFRKETPVSLNPIKPYSLICNIETYQKIWGNYEPCYLTVNGDSSAISYQTDIELSKINTPLYFENYRIQREEELRNIMLRLIMSIILSFSGFLLIIIIHFGIHISSRKKEMERYQILHLLGMEKKTILFHFSKNSLKESLCGTIMAILLLFCYRCFDEIINLNEFADYTKPDSITYVLDILQRSLCLTHWNFIFVIFIILLFINFSILLGYHYWNVYIKN